MGEYTRKEVIGDCTLYLGDCVEIMPTLGKFDAVVTDPPYGMSYKGSSLGGTIIANDGARASLRLYRHMSRLIQNTPTLWFTRWDAWPDVWEIFAACSKINGLLIWDKGHNGMGNTSHWGCSYEMIASMGAVRTRGSRDTSVLSFKPIPGSKRVGHPNEKPTDLMAYLVGKITDPGNRVLDPFMGSGTTLVACAEIGRAATGIEIDPEYFDLACRRVEEAHRRRRARADEGEAGR